MKGLSDMTTRQTAAFAAAAALLAAAATAGDKNPATDWMAQAKVGAFMHFLPGATNVKLLAEQAAILNRNTNG
mgnify:CR=1 FL=1